MRKIAPALIAAALSLAMAPAFAQDDEAARLTTSGNVMVSSGGEYVTATSGQWVMPGQSLMVEAGSAATVTYSDNCKIDYTSAGTYVIPDDCDGAVAYVPAGSTAGAAAGSALTTAAIVGGVVAVTAAAIESNQSDSDTPVSP